MTYSIMMSAFICLSLASFVVTEQLVCPPGLETSTSTVFQQMCYFVDVEQSLRSWPEAQESCQRQGATLLEIYNEDINNFIAKQFPIPYTLIWLGAREKGGTVVWTSGAPLSYTNWILGMSGYTLDSLVAFFTRDELCVRTDSFFSEVRPWIRNRCNDRLSYICQISAVEAMEKQHETSTKTKPQPKVPRPARKSERKVFLLVSSSGLDYPEVRSTPTSRTQVHSSTVCARMCDANERCVMFNFNPGLGECRTFSDKSGLLSIVNSPGWKLWMHRHE